jgi:PKD repeat protein
MKKFVYPLLLLAFAFNGWQLNAQISESSGPTLIMSSEPVVEIPSIASQIADGTFQPSENLIKEVNPKKWGSNTSVPGKGLPQGNDPLLEKQSNASKNPGKAPLFTFEAASATVTPTDPTGAVGPNHFVNSWNMSFRIWDKAGNPLTPAASLGTIFPGTMGDPIVLYDHIADRFLLSEFYSNGFYVAISKGPDPVTSGWWTYSFPTNTFPDYPKFSLWSDGYYITANKDQSSAGTSQVVFALERDKMLVGNTTALMIGFPLTGIVTSGFYSPLGFHVNGSNLPPAGNVPIVYMQDDAWSGVSTDHLKIWSVNVNWTTPANSTISSPQIINTTPFDGLFDGGSFSNIPQVTGSDMDCLQATIMYMAHYRRFATYNTAVFNFVVDLNGADNYSGIRWYELRQPSAGGNWTIYQEGTYAQPNGHSAFSGNMCMDVNGNIALAYTTVSTTLYPALRYTGRYASDPLGVMTFAEQVIANGNQSDPSSRYGDYSQMTIDPSDDVTFWSIGEYFTGGTRKNHVGVFQFAPPALTAQFSGSPTTICAGSSVTFLDQSLGSPVSWNWSFPGGTPSSWVGQTPPAIVYSSAGTYDVTLTVSDGIDTDPETKTGYITVKNVIAEFSGTPASVVVGNSVTFTDNSSCNPTGWSWSFPGGTPSSSTLQNPPAITYNTVGTYDVSLSVTKPGGSDAITKTGYITVIPPEFNMANGTVTTCTGNFYDPGGSGNYTNNLNVTETFYPSTAGSMIKFTFNSFSTELNYDYLRIYNGENTSAPLLGTYHGTSGPGTVTASNASGALTFNFTSDGSIVSSGWSASISCYSATAPPVAAFSASNTTPPISSTVTFTDQSDGFPTSWLWSFSPNTVTYVGGTSATSQNPQVQFNAVGQYTVSLTATNAYGSDSEIKTNYINAVLYEYCIPTYTTGTGSGDYITLVQLGSINNATGASPSPYYTYYSSLSTNLTPGNAYTITLSPGTYSSGNNISVWIDYNQNGVFETAEKLGNVNIPPTPATGTINFTVPANAVSGTTRMRVREVWNNSNFDPCLNYGYGETEDYNVNIQSASVSVDLTVFLEGPYNGTNMSASLTGFIPLNQPYNVAPWNYTGTESVASVPANAIDWVLVELRDAASAGAANSGTRIARKAAFLRNDGKIVNLAGTPILDFGPLSVTSNLFVIIHHRNHISVLSSIGLAQTGGVYPYNFTTAANQAYNGTLAHKQIGPGIWGMFGGNGDGNGIIDNLDEDPIWESEAGGQGYLNSDYNFDTHSNNKDKDDIWAPNLGKGNQVPN